MLAGETHVMNKLFQSLVNFTIQQVALFGLVLALVYYFTAYDNGQNILAETVSMDQEIRKEEDKKKDTDQNLKEEQRMKSAVGLLSQQYVEISKRLPNNLPSIELNRTIDELARSAQVTVKARKPLSLISTEIVDEIPVQVSLEGTFAQMAQFIYMVSSSERIATVKSYNMAPVTAKSTRLRFDATVVGYQLASAKKAKGTP